MFELSLLASIAAVVAAGVWGIFRLRRLLAADLARGMTQEGCVTAVRLMPIAFILCDFLFVLPLSIRLLFTTSIAGDVSPNLYIFIDYFPAALFLDAMFLVLFVIVFGLQVKKSRHLLSEYRQTRRLNKHLLLVSALAMLGLSLLLIAKLAQQSGGLVGFVLKGYGVTEAFNGNGIYSIGLTWVQILAVFLLAYAGAYRKKKGIRLLAFVLIGVEVLALTIMGRRGELVLLGISGLVVWHFLYRRLTRKILSIILFSGFLGMNLLGMIRGNSYSSLSDAAATLHQHAQTQSANGVDTFFYTLTTGEFVVPFASLPEVMAHMGGDVAYRWGDASLGSIGLIVPTALWPDRPEPLSNWYERRFYNANAKANQGHQFFVLTAPYMDFGVFGVALLGILYGWLFARWGVFLARRLDNPVYLTLFALSVGFSLNLIASDAIGSVVVFIKDAVPLLLFAGTAAALSNSHAKQYAPES